MVHSIELLLDPDSDAAIRRIWAKLADAELPSQAANNSPSNRPHISLVVAERIDADVDILLRPIAQWLPIRCVVGAPLLFGGHQGWGSPDPPFYPGVMYVGAGLHLRSPPPIRP